MGQIGVNKYMYIQRVNIEYTQLTYTLVISECIYVRSNPSQKLTDP